MRCHCSTFVRVIRVYPCPNSRYQYFQKTSDLIDHTANELPATIFAVSPLTEKGELSPP
jgi:hypothetical protein